MLLTAAIAIFAFVLGMEVNAFMERRWQLERKRINADVRDCQSSVDEAITQYQAGQQTPNLPNSYVN